MDETENEVPRAPVMTESNRFNESMRKLNGLAVPGGCDHCDAVQELTADKYGPGAHGLTVSHEDGCPWLASR